MLADKLKAVGAFLGIIGMVFSAYLFLDARYITAAEHNKLEKKVNVIELEILLKESLENLYFYRNQVRKYPDDAELQQKVKDAETEVADIKKMIEKQKVINE